MTVWYEDSFTRERIRAAGVEFLRMLRRRLLRVSWCFCLVLAFSGCASSSSHLTKASAAGAATENNPLIDRHEMLSEIMMHMGIPYALNGSDSTGFDCSGFTECMYRTVLHQNLPRSCQEQAAVGIFIDRRELKFGDLLFFQTGPTDIPSHVGIYVGDGLFAHASTSNGVTITPLENSYFKKRYISARRILH